jgi:hypothetical protein
MEELKNETEITKEEKTDEPVDLIEMVRAKHSDEINTRERLGDVLLTQLILCVLLILIFAAIKLAEAQTAQWFIDELKKMSVGKPEEFISQAVSKAIEYIK